MRLHKHTVASQSAFFFTKATLVVTHYYVTNQARIGTTEQKSTRVEVVFLAPGELTRQSDQTNITATHRR
jgi:hypothetical protein